MNKLIFSFLILSASFGVQAQTAGKSMLEGEKPEDYKTALKLTDKQFQKWVEFDEAHYTAVNKIVADVKDQKERAVAIRNENLNREKFRKDLLKEDQVEAYTAYKAELKAKRRAEQKKTYESHKANGAVQEKLEKQN
ncbi:MAG: hypothetical protein IPI60_15940 [Saprospiraceae bacterium]|nr:hypothetical protein [Saprospiraceae bacterium]